MQIIKILGVSGSILPEGLGSGPWSKRYADSDNYKDGSTPNEWSRPKDSQSFHKTSWIPSQYGIFFVNQKLSDYLVC